MIFRISIPDVCDDIVYAQGPGAALSAAAPLVCIGRQIRPGIWSVTDGLDDIGTVEEVKR